MGIIYESSKHPEKISSETRIERDTVKKWKDEIKHELMGLIKDQERNNIFKSMKATLTRSTLITKVLREIKRNRNEAK